MYRKPLIREIEYRDAIGVLPVLSKENDLVFLDSATNAQPFENTNRYSYLSFDAAERIEINDEDAPISLLKEKINNYKMSKVEGLPPFQGGVMGCFGYELLHGLEKIPRKKCNTINFPNLLVGVYDVVLAWDHQERKAWLISTGYPMQNKQAAEKKALLRMNAFHKKIAIAPKKVEAFEPVSIESEVDQPTYIEWVERAKDYILSGDIFEVNLSQCFFATLNKHEQVLPLYLQLRQANPASFSAFLKYNAYAIASASPERFLQVNTGVVETRPIKGTVARLENIGADTRNKEQLLLSEKDRAENTMIVDLMRNDLSRVCESDSVIVEKLCGLESTESVHHLVSVVKGKLKSEFDSLDLFKASFPAGSITGAPKIRAMQIIAELEASARGPYCGSLGFIGFTGDMDTSVLIRSVVVEGKKACFQAGGAIVLDSDPQQEYDESLLKAKKIKDVLAGLL